MRLGVISDVHANLPALEAVLEDMPCVDVLICLGDVIGYNPFPSGCVDLVRRECDLVLQGNHDRELRDPEQYRGNKGAYAGLKLARQELGSQEIEYLQSLPEKREVRGTGLYAVHSHPKATDRYVMPDQFENLKQYLDGYTGLLLGHTHVQHVEHFDEGIILNPGSVGQPRDDDPRAAYAVVDTESLDVELRRVGYDLWTVIDEIHDKDLPDRTAQRLLPDSVGNTREENPHCRR
ncbi:metallophosphoesterase family protein [Salinirussus salinus]|uniref:metallophosphoesterase family protein n=1 Tax=Salinirussus salinus TaxID=1198300 RepID=UPI00135938BA|nr:metallophosphoesterase family protein [Salinirussus salinus]